MFDRHRFLRNAITWALGALVVGCDRTSDSDDAPRVLGVTAEVNRRAHALLSPRAWLAREFTVADNSPSFKANGNTNPDTPHYNALRERQFIDYLLAVTGTVEAPRQFSLAELAHLGERTQITRHDCVERWSAIGQWTDVPLAALLDTLRPTAAAHYVVFHCFDQWEDDTFC